MMRGIGVFVLTVAMIGVASAPASADVVRWHLPGVIDGSADCGDPDSDPNNFCRESNEYLQQFFPAGTRIDFDLTIDTHDTCSSPDVGVYDITEFSVTINGMTATGGGFLGRNFAALFGCPSIDTFLPLYIVGFAPPFGAEGQEFLLLSDVEMFFSGGPGDDLPTVPPAGSFYLEPSIFLRFLGGHTDPGSVVPEPSTLVLVLSGLVTAAARRRRRSSRPRKAN